MVLLSALVFTGRNSKVYSESMPFFLYLSL